MQNTNSPPKYGAEGPPGGVEAWNRQRGQAQQPQQGMAGLGQMVRGMVERQRGPQAGPPQGGMRPWDQVGQAQWPGQGGGPPQGMPPQAQGAPPPMPAAEPPQQSMRPQWMQQMGARARQMPEQQTGMAGLGAAVGKINQMRKANALRGGQVQEQ